MNTNFISSNFSTFAYTKLNKQATTLKEEKKEIVFN